MSENHQMSAADSSTDEAEQQVAAPQPEPEPEPEPDRDQTRRQRIEAIQAEVADAAALRSKMIQAMRRRLESQASSQKDARLPVRRVRQPVPVSKPYPIARPSEIRQIAYGAPKSEAAAQPAPHDDEADSIFAPEPAPVGVLPGEPRPLHPRPLAAGDPAVWDEAFHSAQRVESALARLQEALAREESAAGGPQRSGRSRASHPPRPRLLRVATLFTASFMIGISAMILAYDWRFETSVESRLVALVRGLWGAPPNAEESTPLPAVAPKAKATSVASNDITLPSVKPAEKPLAAPAAVRSVKSLALARLEAFDAQGSADAAIPLSIRTVAMPNQPVGLRLIGLPQHASLSAGKRESDGAWVLKPGENKGLSLRLPPETSGKLTFTVEAIEEKSGDYAAPPQEIRIDVAPAKLRVEPAASALSAATDLRTGPAPLPPQKLPPLNEEPAAEPPPEELQLAAIEEAAEAPALALGIDDPSRPLMARGDALMELGDVASARSFYDRAFELGNVGAARSIARTYDPVVLASMKVKGLRPDPAKALDWYRKAEEAGESGAAQAIAALETYLGQ